MNDHWKRIPAIALAAIFITGFLTGCAEEPEEIMSETIVVDTAVPQKGSLVIQNEFIGTISPQEAVYVVPLVSGEITSVKVELGETVKEGQVLCKIDDTAASLQLESAQASYATAQAGVSQATGGSMELQDIQTEAGIRQLERQVQDTEKSIYESNGKIQELKDSQGDLEKAVSAAKDAYQAAAGRYAAASQLLTTKENMPGIGEKSISGAAQDILGPDIPLSNDTVNEWIANPGNLNPPEEYAAKVSVLKLYQTMISAGFSDADISMTGVNSLSNVMIAAQNAYQTASSGQASVKQGITTYESTKKQTESGLQGLYDNLKTTRKTAEIADGQVKEDAQGVMDAQLNAAGIGIKSAQMQLDMYTVTAPISGVVEAVNIAEKGFAASGNPAFMIANKETMTASFTVSEEVRSQLSVGQKIRVERNDTIYTGNITEIPAMVDQQSGLFKIKASVDTKDQELLTGTTVKITADTRKQENSLLIPYDAVYYNNGESYVYTVQDGKAVKTTIEDGLFDDKTMAVISGLAEDSQVIVSWSPNLRDSVAVEVKGENHESD